LTLTSSALVGPGIIIGSPPGGYAAPAMNEGDVLQIFSTAPDGDLTGSHISADVPIAVFSGNIYTTYGFKPSGFNGGDMAEEQLPPTASWGLEYIGARLSPQAKCDPFFGPGVGMWRVVAAGEGADVTISPAPGVSVEGANLVPGFKFHLDGSGSQTFLTRSKQDPPIPTDFVITGSKPILLAQWLDCEPGLSWGIDSRRLSSGDLSFKLPPGFDHELIVVRETAREVELDGVELLDTRFHTIVPGLVYEIARLDATDLGPCEDAFDDCQHHLVGASWGVTWRGMDVVCSYALTVPSGQSCALPNASCTE
jgi:IgGFc binding protein